MFTLGIDFGTNSVRALIVRCADGAEFGSAVADYPSGHQGVLLTSDGPPTGAPASAATISSAMQRPSSEALRRRAVQARLPSAEWSASASTPPGRARCLSMRATRARRERAGVTISTRSAGFGKTIRAGARPSTSPRLAARHRPHFIAKCGSVYSSEWWWAKIWHCLRRARCVRRRLFVGRAGRLDSLPARQASMIRGHIKRGICAGRSQGALRCRLGRIARQGIPRPARSQDRRPSRPAL